MTPEKQRAAMVRGLHTLAPRIQKLKIQLRDLEDAQLWLINQKWDAERELVGVKIIPIGMTARLAAASKAAMEKEINSMSPERATELLAALEARLEKEI